MHPSMLSTSFRSTLRILIAFAVASGIGAYPARGEKLLFHATFDDTLDAKVAAGDAKATWYPPAGKPDAKPVFAEGIVGKALDIGTGCRVAYSPTGNLRNDRGTITFWVKRAGPQPQGRYTYNLGAWGNADGTWVLLYRWEWYANVNMLHGKGGSGDIGIQVPGDADDGQWHFLAFTWDGNHVRGYQDGVSDAAAEKLNFPAQQFTSFYIGGGDQTSRLIDELKFYDEPLSVSEIKAMYREVAGVRVEPTLVIPRRKNEVKIDGHINADEWAGAAETTGLVDVETRKLAQTPTNMRLMYDDEALYVAFDSQLPEKVRKDYAMTAGMTGILKQTKDRFDTDVDSDDAVEINVMPKLPANADDKGGTWYRLVVNGLNTHYDYSITPTNIISLDWNPQWTSASTLDAQGWHVEIRLPFAGFEVPAPKPGERWGLNLIRLWQALQNARESWAVAPGLTPGYRYAVAHVQFGAPEAPTVRLKDWGPLNDNLLAVRGEILNSGGQPSSVTVQLQSDSDEFKQSQTLTLQPGKSTPFKFDGRLQDPATSLITLTVTDTSGKETLPNRIGIFDFRSQAPVSIRQVLEIRTAHFPTAGLFKTFVDAGRLRTMPLKDLSLTVTMLDEKGKPVLPAKKLSPMPGYVCDAELNVKSLKPGKFQAQCLIQGRNDNGAVTQVAEKTIPFEKLPDPEWLHNGIGITDKAPKPFTPIRRDGDTLYCWGREYRFGNKLFPTQIVTQKSEMLAGPITMALTDDKGKEFSTDATSVKTSWGKATEFRAEFTRGCKLGKVPIQTSCWLECDGFLWTTLRLPPSNATINKLVIRVPIKKEWSEYINPYDYSTVTTGRLKPEGWKGGGQPVWLGNGIGGFQFTTETLAPCQLEKDTVPVRVIPGEQSNVFELTLISTPTQLKSGFEVSWGWIATPVRPSAKDYRRWLTGNGDYSPGYQWYWPPGSDFDPRWLGYSHFVGKFKRPDGKGEGLGSGGPYVVTTMCPTKVPEYEYWGDEWSPSVTGRRAEGGIGQCSVAAKSWVNYFVWCYRQTYKRGRYIGLYYDCAPYLADDNVYHSAGLRLNDGRVVTINSILAARKMAQRMYCMLRELEPEQTMILYHYSGMIDMAFLSWCDVYVDGENFTSRLSKNEQDYHRIFPPDAFLAQSMGHNFGLTNWFLDEFNRSGATNEEDWKRLGVQPVTHLYGLVLLHDSGYWKAYGIKQGYDMVDAALSKYHFDESYTFIPYWGQKIVKLPDKLFASFYRNDAEKRVLMVLLNNNETDLKLRLPLDWKAIGFTDPSKLTVDDAVFHEGASIENGELVTPIGRANMRLLAIEEK